MTPDPLLLFALIFAAIWMVRHGWHKRHNSVADALRKDLAQIKKDKP